MSRKHFFKTVRPIFGGRLTQGQVDGMNNILDYGEKWEYKRGDLAYALGQITHETGKWMQPIREGAYRFGTNYSDAAAQRAVASLYAKGVISTNYASLTGPYRQSYYGRGLIQITWYDNYLKFENLLKIPLVRNPDLALDWDISLDIAFLGMRDGMFRGDKMRDFTFPDGFKQARNIVNGDVRRNGGKTANYSNVFYRALGG